MQSDRRRSARIDIVGELHGHAILLDESVEIRQMSAGGMTIVTKYPFKIQSFHDFQLSSGSDSLVVRGRVIHRRMLVERDETFYVLGIQFVDLSSKAMEWINGFLAMLPEPVRT